MTDTSTLVEVLTEGLMHETDLAVKLATPDGSVWIAKQHLDDHDDDYKSIVIPEWVALDKELEGYITDADVVR